MARRHSATEMELSHEETEVLDNYPYFQFSCGTQAWTRFQSERHELTLPRWAEILDVYTATETETPLFYDAHMEAPVDMLIAWWPKISIEPWSGILD
ncbi:hypothetical protein L1987_15107 [Smallanthus sonchifolius]|uniref:Uncharacterized protein n=1 Tax=Smallanthus sonchifolius TaxID=185202 RepID=A0ACB9J6P5_9ASTR|nr:hypothetical protein L1987_15107 [Smallanthus sonchifolius]